MKKYLFLLVVSVIVAVAVPVLANPGDYNVDQQGFVLDANGHRDLSQVDTYQTWAGDADWACLTEEFWDHEVSGGNLVGVSFRFPRTVGPTGHLGIYLNESQQAYITSVISEFYSTGVAPSYNATDAMEVGFNIGCDLNNLEG